MSARAALHLLEEISDDDVAGTAAIRTQAAFVRALLDELERRRPTGASASSLGAQIDDETRRLRRMIDGEPGTAPPPSMTRLRVEKRY